MHEGRQLIPALDRLTGTSDSWVVQSALGMQNFGGCRCCSLHDQQQTTPPTLQGSALACDTKPGQ